jgi:drug/metabolite transporter (DMT)-like permease
MSQGDYSHIAAPGILFALASALLFGASTPFAKLLLGAIDPWMLAGLLYLGSGLGLADPDLRPAASHELGLLSVAISAPL